jgi:hypothetical protein
MVSVVLFGAGASFGSEDVVPHKPPLGNGQDGLFSRLDAAGGIASQLPNDLKSTFRMDFEKGMAEYYEYAGGDIMRFQRELAAYVAQFKPGPNNTYLRLIQALGARRFIYSSLNYDLLFELAAGALGYTTHYGANASASTVRLLKVHGSCNFWPNIPLGMIRGGTFAGNKAGDVEASVRCLNQDETVYRCANDDALAPAIAMYADGKSVRVCPSFVANQQAQWKDAAAAAKNVFVVGVRLHAVDAHIWDALAKTRASVTYFGLANDKADFFAWKSTAEKKHAFFFEATFAQSIDIMRSRLG